jgi:hypothetical protein
MNDVPDKAMAANKIATHIASAPALHARAQTLQ